MLRPKTSIQGVVLAAGRSTRFKTEGTKLQSVLCGQEMILFPVKLFSSLSIPTLVVVGHKKEQLMAIINGCEIPHITYVEQKEQKGTGHALKTTQPQWTGDHILVINGDMPLVTADIIENLIKTHIDTFADVTFVKAHNQDPSIRGYGRVIRKGESVIVKEERDLPIDVPIICCINAGIYIFKRSFLEKGIGHVTSSSVTGEWYITDLINFANSHHYHIEAVDAPFDRIRGVNTLKDLWETEYIKRAELISFWMENGVQFSSVPHVQLDVNVTIGTGTMIGAGVIIKANTHIGQNCRIEAYSVISASTIGDNVTILPFSVISDSTIETHATIGPLAHLRGEVCVGPHAHIGCFVEATKTTLGSYSKAKHLAYLGNAHIGSHVNIGAGTITCNYNGISKERTTIKDGAHIGALNALVAPICVGENAMTGAGSTLTDSIPDNGFAIARAHQVTKESYAPILRERLKSKEFDEQASGTETRTYTAAHKTGKDSSAAEL